MSPTSYKTAVEHKSGLYLPQWLSVIIPQESTNLILNPSIETNTTGYTAVGAGVVIARTTDLHASRGYAALRITTAAGVASGVYYSALTTVTGQPYTFSVDICADAAGRTYRIYFADAAGAMLGSPTIIVSKKAGWFRASITYNETAGAATRRVYVVRDATAGVPYFDTDGYQVENLAFPTTYFDGDMVGSIQDQVDYQWNGAAHASTSWRSGQTTSGGRVASFNEFGLNVTSLNGMGLPDMENVLEPAYAGGNFYQRTRVTGRTITITADVFGENIQESNRKLADLEQYLTNILRGLNQPIKLRLSIIDTNYTSDTIEAQAYYKDGLTRQLDVLEQTQLTLQFEMASPWFQTDFNSTDGLFSYIDSGVSISHIWRRDLVTGIWSDWATVAGGAATIYCAYESPDGRLYIGGDFTTINAVANCNNVGYYDPITNTWNPMTNGTGAAVRCIIREIDFGDIICGGDFVTVGAAVPCQAKLAAWREGVGWTVFNAGATAGSVYTVAEAIYYTGAMYYIYFGGSFTSWNGIATNYMAYITFDPVLHTYSAGAGVGLGMNGNVNIIKCFPRFSLTSTTEDLVVGGDFTLAPGGGTVNRIFRLNPVTVTPTAFGTGFGAGGTFDIHYDEDKRLLYAFGTWTLDGSGNTVNAMAQWNGFRWEAALPGVSTPTSIKRASYSKREGLLLSGGFTNLIGLTLSSVPAPGLRILKSGSVVPWDEYSDGATGYAIAQYYGNSLIRWFTIAPASSRVSYTNIITVNSKLPVKPFFVFESTFGNGQFTPWLIRSYTTGKIIIPGLKLFGIEIAILDLSLDRLQVITSRGGRSWNRLSEFLFPTNFDFYLMPGRNIINVFCIGTGSIHIGWRDQYRSIALP